MADNINLPKLEEVIANIPNLKKELSSKIAETEAYIETLRQKKAELLAIEEEKTRAEAEKAALIAAKKAEEEAKKKAKEAGMDGHIAKPIDRELLIRTLQEVLQ